MNSKLWTYEILSSQSDQVILNIYLSLSQTDLKTSPLNISGFLWLILKILYIFKNYIDSIFSQCLAFRSLVDTPNLSKLLFLNKVFDKRLNMTPIYIPISPVIICCSRPQSQPATSLWRHYTHYSLNTLQWDTGRKRALKRKYTAANYCGTK